MNKREIIAAIVTVVLIVFMLAQWAFKLFHTLHEQHTVVINGVSITYLVKGNPKGKPILLLHGNGGSHKDLYVMTDLLAQAGYLVWAPDSRGQGQNPPVEEYHYSDMADDMHQFVQQVINPYYALSGASSKDFFNQVTKSAPTLISGSGTAPVALPDLKPAVFGWSDGGIIALMTEVKYPGTWEAIITSGANICPDCGVWDLEQERANPKDTSALYMMMLYEPDMTVEDMQSIQCPCLIVAGENDLISLEHTHLIGDNIPNGEVMIIKGADHGSHILHNPKMGRIVVDYLKKIEY